MSVASTSSVSLPLPPVAAAPPRSASVKDRDGDYDNGAPEATEAKASTPAGVGGNLDITA